MKLNKLGFLLGLMITVLAPFSGAHAQTIKGTIVVTGGEAMLPLCVGHTCSEVWGRSSLSLGVNGASVGALSQQGSTPGSIATALCNQMTSAFPVQCAGVSNQTINSATMAVQANANFQITPLCKITVPTNVLGCLFSATLTGAFDPAYQVLSIVYAPPGDRSSNGFANANSTGTTTTVGTNFVGGTSTTYSAGGGLLGQSSLGVTFGVSAATGNTHAFSVTYQSGTGSQLVSVEQVIDHTQDQFFLWLNPEMTFSGTGNATTYSAGTVGNQPMDIVNVSAAGLLNPSLIPLGTLRSQAIQPGVVEPGLSKVCAHPLPDDQCTVANACGCVPSDFTAILATDPLIGTSQTIQPSQIDASRFVFVNSQILEGPAQAGGDAVLNSFTESDSTVQSLTESESLTTSTSYSTSSGVGIPFLFTLTFANTSSFASTISESQGTQNGSSHQASVTLGSDKTACFEHVDIYEDTAFHTFAFALPAAPPPECQ